MSIELKFVRFSGNYYIPANSRTYKELVKLGLPNTRILEETRAALSLVLRKKNIQASMVPYRLVRDKFHARLRDMWTGPGLTCTFKGHAVTLNARPDSYSEKTLARVEKLLYNYAYRWGLNPNVTITTTKKGRVKIYADLKPSKLRIPVITVSKDVVSQEKQELLLGSHRLLTLVQGRFLYWWLEAKTGPSFVPLTYGKCLLSEVGGQYEHIRNILSSFQD